MNGYDVYRHSKKQIIHELGQVTRLSQVKIGGVYNYCSRQGNSGPIRLVRKITVSEVVNNGRLAIRGLDFKLNKEVEIPAEEVGLVEYPRRKGVWNAVNYLVPA